MKKILDLLDGILGLFGFLKGNQMCEEVSPENAVALMVSNVPI